MDRQSDSPHPPLPRAAAVLDLYTSNNAPPVEVPLNVLRVVPSTQPLTPPPIVGVAARRLHSRSKRRAAGDSLLVPPTTEIGSQWNAIDKFHCIQWDFVNRVVSCWRKLSVGSVHSPLLTLWRPCQTHLSSSC